MKLLLLNGANLNMLGKRDPEHYGAQTLEDICAEARSLAKELGAELECFATNYEGTMIEKIQEACMSWYQGDIGRVDAILINAGAWTHYSRAIQEALRPFADDCGPIYELHMSNTHKREEWRHVSVISPLATGILMGMGADVYTLGVRAAVDYLKRMGK